MKKLDFSYMGPILKQARTSAKITQEELAERVGVTARYIMAIENEEKGVGLENLILIIRTLNISADTIFYPQRETDNSNDEQLYRMIRFLNSRDKKILLSTAKQMLEIN